jgi:hypothetical protein
LANQETSDAPSAPTTDAQPNRIGRSVQKIKCYLHARRSAKKQETPQDRASRRTANATVAIAFLTVAVVIVGGLQYFIFKAQLQVMADQLTEMRGTGEQTDQLIETNRQLAEAGGKQAQAAADSAKTAQDNMVASQRAWVGPRNAKSATGPELEKPLDIVIEYQNTGREPALETVVDSDVFVATSEEDNSGLVSKKVDDFISRCKIKWMPTQKGVVFPSGNTGSAYELTKTLDAEDIDQDVLDGAKSIIIDGCFVYKSAGGIHRSSFCYFFTAKKTKPTNWRICAVGNDAD